MIATLITLVILTQADGYVDHNSSYFPRIGENAVLQAAHPDNTDLQDKRIRETHNAFLDILDVTEYEAARFKVVSANKGNRAVIVSETKKIIDGFKDRNLVITLKKHTPVQVLGYGAMSSTLESIARPKTNTVYYPLVDCVFVRVIEGPHKGRAVWVSRLEVIVPGSKPFDEAAMKELDKVASADGPDTSKETKETPLSLIDTAWEPSPSGEYIMVYARIRNTTGKSITALEATVDFEDVRGRLVKSEQSQLNPRTIEPGDIGTLNVMTRKNERIDHYDLRFEADSRES